MSRRNVYCMVAGPGAGDSLAAELALALRVLEPQLSGYGITGPALLRMGMHSIASIADIADLVADPAKVSRRDYETSLIETMARLSPRVVIFVGFSAFHLRLAEACHLRRIPTLVYAPPHVSTFSAAELAGLSQFVTRVLGVFPDENAVFAAHAINYTAVGSPHLDRCAKVMVRREMFGLDAETPIVAYLLGVRQYEFLALVPQVLKVHAQLQDLYPGLRCLMPLARNAEPEDLAAVFGLPAQAFVSLLEMRTNPGERLLCQGIELCHAMSLEIMALANVVLSNSGTTSLECALLGTPMVVAHSDSGSSEHTNFSAMINQIAGKLLVPELAMADSAAVAAQLNTLLRDAGARSVQAKAFAGLRAQMSGRAAERAAVEVSHYLLPPAPSRQR